MQKEVVYFAYGSNMNPDQMAERCPGAKAVCPAKLRNYRLAERKYADIDWDEGSNVYGVMYTVPENEMEKLDGYEGAPRIYERIEVRVEFAMKPYMAVTYILTPEMKKERDGIPFPEDYRKRCSVGAEHYHIPNDFEYVTLATYGTLMTGEHNHHLVQSSLSISPGMLKGTLYDTGYGFPAFTQEGDSTVVFEIIRIPRKDWPRVDQLEGYPNLYTRKFIPLFRGNITVGAWVYIMNELPPQAKVIKDTGGEHGVVSWRARNPLMFDKMVFWNSDRKEDVELTVDLTNSCITRKMGGLDLPESRKLDDYTKGFFRDLLEWSLLEIWQTEYRSNGDGDREWSVKLYRGDELVKSIHGTDIHPMLVDWSCFYVIMTESRELFNKP